MRRLPYLFSVAPHGFSVGLRAALTPPSPAGFPPTHAILDEIVGRVPRRRRGRAYRPAVSSSATRFTIADAGVYGQLGMNLADPTAADDMPPRALPRRSPG